MICDKILDYSARIGVVGLGYVGLQLAVLCARKGYRVVGMDLNKNRVKRLCWGESYVTGISNKEIQQIITEDKFLPTADYEDAALSDIIFICTPTPLTPDHQPDYSYLFDAVETVARQLKRQQLIIVESTVAPGTTAGKILPRFTGRGFNAGEGFYLAYSPERVDPGNEIYCLENTPKLVAGITPNCRYLARSLYGRLGIPTIEVASTAVAEMAKILENVYRDVNIALVNEMAQICHQKGISIWEVVEAASTKPYGFQAFYPGPGVGGHCIPVDSVYYTHWAQESGKPARLAEQARQVNMLMPQYIVERLREILAGKNQQLAGSKILILGVTYKKDVNDLRESPVIELMELLAAEGALLSFHDPYIEKVQTKKIFLVSGNLEEEYFASQDCIVLTVAHSSYNLTWLAKYSPLVFDLTNTIPSLKKEPL